ncbi:ScbR family autoregulator-binding transcription factor [Streptomyces sp. NPDC049585]|uniref:ScbR family autoregulator-binding transcription factor n=1 Tax=Streptomyces sp. NPDC049585 TaxID=3155154 RepID=UPI0034357DC7
MEQQERAERTRRALIRGAADVFDRIGYERATLSRISAAAGATKGALYFHFSTKADLAQAVRDEARTASTAAVDALARRPVLALQTVVDLTHHLSRALRTDPLTRADVRLSRDAEFPERSRPDCYEEWGAAVRSLLQRAKADGSLLPDADEDSVAALALSLVAGAELFSRDGDGDGYGGAGRGADAEWIARVWALVLPRLVPQDRLPLLRPAGIEVGSEGE